MLSDFNLVPKVISLKDDIKKELVRKFLACNGLEFEGNVDFTIVYLQDDEIVATGSLSNNIIKCVAVSPRVRGTGILAKLMTKLVTKLYKRGYKHHFIFTKPRYIRKFTAYGFTEIVRAEPYVSLLEHGIEYNIKDFIAKIEDKKVSGKIISSMVVDCNPVTQDHILAINLAAQFSDWLHLFLISEPKFYFPLNIRLKLLEESIANLSNVTIHLGGEYMCSNLTFPKYFLRKEEASRAYAYLCCAIFGNYIVPALNITHRYIRKEPDSQIENIYNSTIKEILPKYGVEIQEVENLLIKGKYMSAKLLRQLILEEDWKTIEVMISPAVYDFLKEGSAEANLILERLKIGKIPYERV